jgi:hypothetical protein
MNIDRFRQRISKLYYVIILLCLPSLTFYSDLTVSAQEPPFKAEIQDAFLVNQGLDEDASAWGVYVEGSPTWILNNATTPSLDGKSLRCGITGGDPYSNVHCYRNLPAEPNSADFSLSMSFYYQPASSFNNVGAPSIVQGLEFTMNKWDQGLSYEWALQWDNVDPGAPKWRYWDAAHTQPVGRSGHFWSGSGGTMAYPDVGGGDRQWTGALSRIHY